SNLEFLNKRRVGTYQHGRVPEGSRTQMYYEHGIFSTIYGGKVMPTWIKRRRKGPSISFTIPSSPNKLRGLNLSYVQTLIRPFHQLIDLPHIKIRNMTKNLTWLYGHHLNRVNVGGKSLTFLSHWMFGENEMEDGDQLTISIKNATTFEWQLCDEFCVVKKRVVSFANYSRIRVFGDGDDQVTTSIKHKKIYKRVVGDDQLTNYSRIRECGVSFVYDDGKNEKEEDPLSYYKSLAEISLLFS
ncbi:hypothetical protein Tco_1356824, partial [Tanacetum coccineum]